MARIAALEAEVVELKRRLAVRGRDATAKDAVEEAMQEAASVTGSRDPWRELSRFHLATKANKAGNCYNLPKDMGSHPPRLDLAAGSAEGCGRQN